VSRIEEAMRRAALAPVVELNRHPAGDVATVLDDYPIEHATPIAVRTASEPSIVHDVAPKARPSVGRGLRFDVEMEGKLVTTPGLPPMALEQYRRLGATVHEHQVERGLKMLMVTSAVPAEGKTLTVVNLALTLSESFKRRVLLIDADLRQPSLHEIFGLPNSIGLGEVLDGAATGIPFMTVSTRLSVLPAGQPRENPMAGLTSPRMMALLEQASDQFDWVLLDAPPVLLLPDAQLLAREAGAVVFVIKAGTTPFATVEKAISSLGRDYIVGSVLNRVEWKALPAAEGYYGNYRRAPGL
jgi:capsular exopolysaccharide synthesis family protein